MCFTLDLVSNTLDDPAAQDLTDYFGPVPCSADPELWFAEEKSHAAAQDRELAKGICSTCPVMLSCRSMARREGIIEGVWGGEDADQRADWSLANGINQRYQRVVYLDAFVARRPQSAASRNASSSRSSSRHQLLSAGKAVPGRAKTRLNIEHNSTVPRPSDAHCSEGQPTNGLREASA